MATVRELVKEIQVDLRERPGQSPTEMTEHLNKLSALIGNIGNEETDAELAFIAVQAKVPRDRGGGEPRDYQGQEHA
jgi:hypothetical protein